MDSTGAGAIAAGRDEIAGKPVAAATAKAIPSREVICVCVPAIWSLAVSGRP